jgi:hypothetical protein
MSFYLLTLGILATWRVTHFLQAEDGPGDIVVRVRARLGDGHLGKLLDCFYCLSVWVAVPLAVWIGQRWDEKVLLVLGFSGGAILLERATDRAGKVVE